MLAPYLRTACTHLARLVLTWLVPSGPVLLAPRPRAHSGLDVPCYFTHPSNDSLTKKSVGKKIRGPIPDLDDISLTEPTLLSN